MMGISLLLAFLFRLAAVYGRADLFDKKSIIFAMAFMQLFYVTPCIYTSFAIHSTEDTVLNYISLNHPKMLNFFKSQPCFLLAIDTNVFTYFLFSWLETNEGQEICKDLSPSKVIDHYSWASVCTSYLYVRYCFDECFYNFDFAIACNSSNMLCGFFICSLHTTVNGLIMLMLIRPYREFLIKQWKIIFLREKVQRVFYSK
uniref:Uncharacterized protein n=1 Tax=Ditylenchus dipsaci TaxID=166011 RepID=A0A915E3C1_9BILA